MKKELNKKELKQTSGGSGADLDAALIGFIFLGGLAAVGELKVAIKQVENLREKGENEKANKIVEETYKKVDGLNNAELSKYVRTILILK